MEVNIKDRDTRKTLKQGYDLYCKFLKVKHQNQETIKRSISNCNVIFYFLDTNIKIHNITKEDIKKIQINLSKLPKNIKNQPFFKDKNIKELIKKDSKILDNYEKITNKTIDNYMTFFKTMFNFFVESDFVSTNIFTNIKRLTKLSSTNKRSFETFEINKILNDLDTLNNDKTTKIKRFEERNLIIVNLMTGCRLAETLNIKVEDIDIKNRIIKIELEDTETKKHKRMIAIHNDLLLTIKEQIKNKNKEDYLFFNNKKRLNIIKNISKTVNDLIKKYLPNKENKKRLNIHSLRRNFIQECYDNNIEEIVIKCFVAHSVDNNITFAGYNDYKIDNSKLINLVDNVSFKDYDIRKNIDINKVKNITISL